MSNFLHLFFPGVFRQHEELIRRDISYQILDGLYWFKSNSGEYALGEFIGNAIRDGYDISGKNMRSVFYTGQMEETCSFSDGYEGIRSDKQAQ